MSLFEPRPGHGGAIEAHEQHLLDFSVNLNPLVDPIPDELWLSWKDRICQYPPATPHDLEIRLAQCLGIPEELLLVTPGGNAALDLALRSIGEGVIIIPSPCFSEYPYQAAQKNRSYRIVKRPSNSWTTPAAFLDFDIPDNGIVLLGNPNNPTGTLLPPALLLDCIKTMAPRNVRWIIDEAFIEFTAGPEYNSLISHLHELPQTYILGSLTKQWNIPGLRIGYLATSNTQSIQSARNQQLTWPMNGLVHAWADQYLNPIAWTQLRKRMQLLHYWRSDFQKRLQAQGVLHPLVSDCNFFLAILDQQQPTPDAFYQKLLAKGIHLRRGDNIPGMAGSRYFRLAVRPPKENERLLEVIDDSLKNPT